MPDISAAEAVTIAQLRAEIEALKAADRTRRSGVATDRVTPHHSAGIEHNVADTWSLYDQELARKGEHPHQLGFHADWVDNPTLPA